MDSKQMKKSDIWLILAPILILVLSYIAKSNLIESIASFAGVIYVILIAKENKYGYIFGTINVIFYSIVTWQKGLYGSSVLNVIYSIPIFIYGYMYWNKNQGKEKGKIKRLSKDSLIKFIICTLLIMIIYSIFAKTVLKVENILVDTIVSCLGLIGNILMSKKYIEQWAIWLIVNSTNLIFWGVTLYTDINVLPLMIMSLIYLCNTIYGFGAWYNKYNSSLHKTKNVV